MGTPWTYRFAYQADTLLEEAYCRHIEKSLSDCLEDTEPQHLGKEFLYVYSSLLLVGPDGFHWLNNAYTSALMQDKT